MFFLFEIQFFLYLFSCYHNFQIKKPKQVYTNLSKLFHLSNLFFFFVFAGTSIGECHVEVEVDEGGASAPSATVRSAALSTLDQIVLPTEEEQNKINKLIEDSEYLETEKLNLEKIFKRAEKMEYAAKDRESKAEETAEQQREASARCQIELVSATSKYVEMNDVVDRTCTSSTTAEKHMEKITRQLNEHKEQFQTILKSHTSASTECDQVS